MMSTRLRLDSPAPWLIALLAIGGLVRFAPVIGSSFPAGDGGLFATMIGDIREAGFALPAYTSYNGGDIPFAYPPLALYVGAVLPFEAVTSLQWLPPTLATACIVPVYLAGASIGPRTVGIAAASYYALAPFGWYWLVQGGGLTRSLALLLGISAAVMALRARPVWVGLLGGLTALTHPETAIFAAITVLAILVARRAWTGIGIAAAVSAIVVAPWLAIVIATHGPDPFLAAAGARSVNPFAAVLSMSGGRPGILDLAAAVGLIGLMASRVAWLYAAAALTAVLLTTSLETHLGPLLALGVGVTVTQRAVPREILVAAGLLLLIGAGVGIGNARPLGDDDRRAMAWVAEETDADARFAVLSGEIWSRADEAEWFPYLSGRISVVSMQGREWLPDWEVLDRQRHDLERCMDHGCIEDWVVANDVHYIYLADDCCGRLEGLLEDALVHRDGAASIYAVRRVIHSQGWQPGWTSGTPAAWTDSRGW